MCLRIIGYVFREGVEALNAALAGELTCVLHSTRNRRSLTPVLHQSDRSTELKQRPSSARRLEPSLAAYSAPHWRASPTKGTLKTLSGSQDQTGRKSFFFRQLTPERYHPTRVPIALALMGVGQKQYADRMPPISMLPNHCINSATSPVGGGHQMSKKHCHERARCSCLSICTL